MEKKQHYQRKKTTRIKTKNFHNSKKFIIDSGSPATFFQAAYLINSHLPNMEAPNAT